MSARQITPLDKFLVSAGKALRTVAAPAGRTARKYPASGMQDTELENSERSHAAGLMRVNHAGEVAAQALYQGHAVTARDKTIEQQMRQAAAEEFDHLAWCERRLQELGEQPSRLSPVWYAGAFAIGAASGALGDKWSLGFIAETERQVCDHLAKHLDALPADDEKSRAILKQMHAEEAEHGENAKNAGAAELPITAQKLMRTTAKVMTKTAYWV